MVTSKKGRDTMSINISIGKKEEDEKDYWKEAKLAQISNSYEDEETQAAVYDGLKKYIAAEEKHSKEEKEKKSGWKKILAAVGITVAAAGTTAYLVNKHNSDDDYDDDYDDMDYKYYRRMLENNDSYANRYETGPVSIRSAEPKVKDVDEYEEELD